MPRGRNSTCDAPLQFVRKKTLQGFICKSGIASRLDYTDSADSIKFNSEKFDCDVMF